MPTRTWRRVAGVVLALVAAFALAVATRADAADAARPRAAETTAPAAGIKAPPPLWTGFTLGLRKGLDGIGRIPELGPDLRAAAEAGRGGLDGATAAGLVGSALGLGSVLALLVMLVGRRLARQRLVGPAVDFAARLRIAGWGAGVEAAALATFSLAGYLALLRFVPAEAGFVRLVGLACLATASGFGAYMVAGRFLLTPGHAERRLMPLPHADRHMAALAAYGVLGPAFTQSLLVLREVEPDPASLAGWTLAGTTVLTIYKVAWFWLARHDIATLVAVGNRAIASGDGTIPREGGALHRAAGIALPWIHIGVAFALWFVAQVAADSDAEVAFALAAVAGLTQTLVVILPIVAAGATALARSLGRRALAGRDDAVGLALAATASTVTTGIVWVLSLGLLVKLWSAVLVDPVGADAVSSLRPLVRAGAAIVTGWAIWTFCRAYFDAHAPAPRNVFGLEDENGHPPIATRLATVLPLIRNLVLGAVLAVTALVVLASLGLEITPFLAGFGVIGLAISFGSQALVRDIVSGIFFMADDAFRVGEYIDTGRLKGSVEKITLRSVQLRHQNGPVHTIPFGQLQAITNFSRDWATVKFLLRLDRETDPDLARKTIKKVGATLSADPEWGPELIGPLKMQGIQDITDTALVVRCKFSCKPFKPTGLQREALKRIHRAFAEAGIAFASPPVMLRDGAAASPRLLAAASSSADPAPTAVAAGP